MATEQIQPKKIKVLMLGWEYPPMLTGGLGPACYGLSKALSKLVDLELILPRSEKGFEVENVQITGLNHLDAEEFEDVAVVRRYTREKTIPPQYEEFASVEYIPIEGEGHFNPYPTSELLIEYRLERKTEWKKVADERKETEYVEEIVHEPLVKVHNGQLSARQIKGLLNDEETYGPRIMEKVAAYTSLVRKLALTKSFDVIHAHDWITIPAAIELKHLTGKPLFLHIHSLETDRVHPSARNRVYDIEKMGMESADMVFPVSHYTKECIVNYYGISPEKIHPVYNGIELTTEETRRTPSRKPDYKTVLFLGRVTRQKGPEFLVRTAAKVLSKMENVRFVVAGIGDQLRETMFLAKELGISDKVQFLGFLNREAVKEALGNADAYFMPSISEPFGLSALEAAQAGLPVILSKQSGASEVLPNVLSADFWDTDRFANYLYAALNYEGLRKDLVRLTTQDIPRLTWLKAAEDVFHYYGQLLNQTEQS